MKKLLFSLLACGMFASTFAQIDVVKKITTETSDKWVITANNLKGATGRILMDNPAGSKWVVYIYAMADNKYIMSAAESNNKGSFTIFPGEYKITINNVPVLNVPVQKGHDTKIKCGVFDVEDEAVWYLHDETGDAYYTSGDKPQKLVLPVGTYTYKIGGSDQRVVVKEEVAGLATGKIIETDQWIAYPREEPLSDFQEYPQTTETSQTCNIRKVVGESELKNAGSLYLRFPGWWYVVISILDELTCGSMMSSCPCPPSYPLPNGRYKVLFGEFWVDDVLIMSDYETRIKTGTLNFKSGNKPCGLYNLAKDTCYIYGAGGGTPRTITWSLLPRQYSFFYNDNWRTVTIRDGEAVEFDEPVEKQNPKKDSIYSVRPLITKNKNDDSSRVIFNYDSTFSWAISWSRPNGGTYTAQNWYPPYPEPYDIPPAPKWKSIDSGTYKFRLMRVEFPGIKIPPNSQIRFKFGYLDISTYKEWSLAVETHPNDPVISSNDGRKRWALPVGIYIFKVKPHSYSTSTQNFFIKIEEGKTVVWNLY